MQYKRYFLLFFILLSASLSAQSSITISGYVEDEASRERLVGVNVIIPGTRIGTFTNNFGFFSLTVPSGTQEILISYIGYETQAIALQQYKGGLLTVYLKEQPQSLGEVVVTAEVPEAEQSQMSSIDISMKQVKKMPAIFGEVDLLRAIQLLPGVQSGGEGSVGFYVRGGGPDQNLILLDGVPVYNVSHLFGFFSVFNADAIKSTQLIKGGFPARYGGRLSSVLDITMKEGNMRKFKGDVSLGIIAAKMTLEGPIIKDKTSFMISGRRTYIDALIQPFIAMQESGLRTGYYFGDLNAKINHKISNKDRLYLSFFTNVDRFYFRERLDGERFAASLQWGNRTGALRWNRLINPKMFMNTALTYTRYELGIRNEIVERDYSFSFGLRSNIEDYGGKVDFDYIRNNKNHIRFGSNFIHHRFQPAGVQVRESGSGFTDLDSTINLSPVLRSLEWAFYIENDQTITKKIKVNYGLHLNTYVFDERYYASLQPRVSGRYLLTPNSAFKLSFARMQQYLHLLSSNNGIGLPSDLWVPATDIIPPMTADQVAAGYSLNFGEQKWEFSTEVYYKKMTDLIEYRSGSSFINPNDWQSKIETGGLGWAYGIEFFLQRKVGRLSGWAGYTLSWNNRQFENLNNGEIYPYRFDRRHDMSLVLSYDIAKEFDVAFTWVYGTGIATNLPVFMTRALGDYSFGTQVIENYGDLNSFRFPAYHRGDFSFNWNKTHTKFESTWSLSVYNFYNRQNAFFLFTAQENGSTVVKQVSLFPILPSLSYRIKF